MFTKDLRTLDCANRLSKLVSSTGNSLQLQQLSFVGADSVREKSILILHTYHGVKNDLLQNHITEVLSCTDIGNYSDGGFIESFIVSIMQNELRVDKLKNKSSVLLTSIAGAFSKAQLDLNCKHSWLLLSFLRALVKHNDLLISWCRHREFLANHVNTILTILGNIAARCIDITWNVKDAFVSCFRFNLLSLCLEAIGHLLTFVETEKNALNKSAMAVIFGDSRYSLLEKIHLICERALTIENVLMHIINPITTSLSSFSVAGYDLCLVTSLSCISIARYYQFAVSCQVSIASITRGYTAEVVNKLQSYTSYAVDKLFEIWQHAYSLRESIACVTSGTVVAGDISWSRFYTLQVQGARNYDQNLNHIMNCFSNLIAVVSPNREISGISDSVSFNQTYLYHLTRVVSDYVLFVFVQQCSSGELLLRNFSSRYVISFVNAFGYNLCTNLFVVQFF